MFDKVLMAKVYRDNAEWIKFNNILNNLPEKYYDKFSEMYLPYRDCAPENEKPNMINKCLEKYDGHIVGIRDINTLLVDNPRSCYWHNTLYDMVETTEIEVSEKEKAQIFAMIFGE